MHNIPSAAFQNEGSGWFIKDHCQVQRVNKLQLNSRVYQDRLMQLFPWFVTGAFSGLNKCLLMPHLWSQGIWLVGLIPIKCDCLLSSPRWPVHLPRMGPEHHESYFPHSQPLTLTCQPSPAKFFLLLYLGWPHVVHESSCRGHECCESLVLQPSPCSCFAHYLWRANRNHVVRIIRAMCVSVKMRGFVSG